MSKPDWKSPAESLTCEEEEAMWEDMMDVR